MFFQIFCVPSIPWCILTHGAGRQSDAHIESGSMQDSELSELKCDVCRGWGWWWCVGGVGLRFGQTDIAK